MESLNAVVQTFVNIGTPKNTDSENILTRRKFSFNYLYDLL